MRRFLSAYLVATLLAIRAVAQPLSRLDSDTIPIALDAESIGYDQQTNAVTAHGNVVIRRGETEVRADEVRVNRTTNEVFARGHVAISDPEGTLIADEVHLNLEEETGTLQHGAVSSRRMRYSLTGDRIEKQLGQSYRIENGKFTTCQCADGPPSWSIAGKEVDVALSGYGHARGATFNILDVPVFYVPRAVFPINRERQSGFLLPRFSVSNRRGFQMLAPFYWAIDRSQDLTLAPDFETGARAGVVGDYRYAWRRDFQGQLSASYFNEFFRGASVGAGNQVIPNDRWSVVTEHTNAVGSARLYADLFLTSDDSFVREINTFTFDRGRDTAIRTLPFTASRVGVLQLWERAALRVQGTFYQDLLNGQSTDPSQTPHSEGLTLQRLPDIDWWGQQLVADHVLARLAVSGSDFQRREGIDGLRLDLKPEAMVPLHVGPVFGSVRAGMRETAYHLTEHEMPNGFRGDDPTAPVLQLPTNRTRETFHLTAEAGTSFNRVYDFTSFGFTKLKHTIEPLAEYTFVPSVAQDDLPVFDGEDRDNRRSLLTYGVVSRLLAKLAPPPSAMEDAAATSTHRPSFINSDVRELMRLSLLQSFDTQRLIPPVSGRGRADHFSDVDLGLRVQPSSAFSLRAQAGYDTSAADVSSTSVGVRYRGTSRIEQDSGLRFDTRNSLGVTYRFITRSLLQQIDGDLQLRLTDTLGFIYADRIDVLNNRFLENYFGLRILSQCDCWGLDFAVVDKSNPQEVEVRMQFTLAGLGSSGNARPVAARGAP